MENYDYLYTKKISMYSLFTREMDEAQTRDSSAERFK